MLLPLTDERTDGLKGSVTTAPTSVVDGAADTVVKVVDFSGCQFCLGRSVVTEFAGGFEDRDSSVTLLHQLRSQRVWVSLPDVFHLRIQRIQSRPSRHQKTHQGHVNTEQCVDSSFAQPFTTKGRVLIPFAAFCRIFVVIRSQVPRALRIFVSGPRFIGGNS